MKLLFLGTKGEIEEFTEKHKYNSSLLVVSADTRLLIDYGMLHRYSIEEIMPNAILITHAHPDTYAWLKQDIKTSVPVYLTQHTFDYGRYRPDNPIFMNPENEYQSGPFKWSTYPVMHSIRCPAVGFKIIAEKTVMIYNPDVVDIIEKDKILDGVDLYIGDGSAIRANLVRRRDDKLFGHTRISAQINWCKDRGIKNIIFTHLGKETIEKEEEFKKEHPEVVLAYDGMELEI